MTVRSRTRGRTARSPARVEDFGRLGYGPHFRFTEVEQMDQAFVLLAQKAYAIGQQQEKSRRP